MHLPWTIWRQTFLELWRLLLLSSGVLVTVISFAVSVRLTAQGKLGPLDTIRYMFLVMPPMLQFALPFAAAFAATLTYHRMSQDNELTAAAAGGVSHRVLIIPALASALLLGGIMWALLDRVVPRFWRDIENVVTQDAARMVVGPIEAGQPLTFGGMLVHADSVRRLGPNPETGASETLLLFGVLAVSVDDKGQVQRETAASRAVAEFSSVLESSDAGGPGPSGQVTQVAMRLIKPVVFLPEEGLRPSVDAVSVYKTLAASSDDNPKFRTNSELRDLPEHPDMLRFVDAERRELAFHIAERESTRAIDAALRANGSVKLDHESGRTFTIHAAGMQYVKDRWELIPTAKRAGIKTIEVDLAAGSGDSESMQAGTIHLVAPSGGLRSDLGKDPSVRRLTICLELENVAGRLRADDPAGERKAKVFQHLLLEHNSLTDLLKLTTPQLLLEADRRNPGPIPDRFIADPARDLRQTVQDVGREVVSKLHERWASCVSAMVMVLAGTLTAMRLGGSLPLTVYLWSFFPALFSVVTIATGQQMTHKIGTLGLGVLWAGAAMLAAYTAAAFVVVRRH